MNKEMTIEELAEKANKILGEKKFDNDDSRYSNSVSVRRIRDYLTKGLLNRPIKKGRTNYFNKEHLKQLVFLREVQLLGLSDKYLRTATLYSVPEEYTKEEDKDIKEDALDLIKKISERSNITASLGSTFYSELSKSTSNTVKENINPPISLSLEKETWEQFYLDSSKTVLIKIRTPLDNSLDFNEIEQNFKQLINLKKGEIHD